MASSAGAQLVYDPKGRLFEVSSGGQVTRFVHDGDQMSLEYNSAGAVTRRHLFVGVDEPVLEATGAALSCTTARFPHANHQGSIIAQANCAGARTAVNAYDEHGIPQAGNIGRFQYTGQAWLPEIGMYYYKARIYSPTLGRFLQTDPIGYEDQVNLYAYVGNDPVNMVDPSGQSGFELDLNFSAKKVELKISVEFGSSKLDLVQDGELSLSVTPKEVELGAASNGALGKVEGSFGVIALGKSIGAAAQSMGTGLVNAVRGNADAKIVFSNEKQALIEMAKADKRIGVTRQDMRSYEELNRSLPDPMPTNKVRIDEGHLRGGPHSRRPHGHVGPVDHIPILDPNP